MFRIEPLPIHFVEASYQIHYLIGSAIQICLVDNPEQIHLVQNAYQIHVVDNPYWLMALVAGRMLCEQCPTVVVRQLVRKYF